MKIFAKPIKPYFALFFLISMYFASGRALSANQVISLQEDSSQEMTVPYQGGYSDAYHITVDDFQQNASSSVHLNLRMKVDNASNKGNFAIALYKGGTACALSFISSQMDSQGYSIGNWVSYDFVIPVTNTTTGGCAGVLGYTGSMDMQFSGFAQFGSVVTVNGDGTLPRYLISTETYEGDFDDSTHIISLDPADGFYATSTGSTTDVIWNYVYNINENDIGTAFSVLVTLHNIDQNVLLSTIFSEDDIIVYDFVATSSGVGGGSGFFTLKNGNYRIKAELSKTLFGLRIPFQTPYDTRSNQFTVGSSTFIGRLSQNSYSSLNGLYQNASSTASYSYNLNTCNPFTGSPSTLFLNTNFDVGTCAGVLFIPDQGLLNDSLDSLKTNVLNRFPLGYVTDFVSIVATTSTSSLTVIDAYTPSVLPGGGSHIRLDLANVFDSMLYATTSRYANVSASSTKTFYEITSGYWKIIVYISAFLYILARVVGTASVPSGFGTTLNDPAFEEKQAIRGLKIMRRMKK